MSPLRKRMIRVLQLHRLSSTTMKAYLTSVTQLANHWGRSSDELSAEQVGGIGSPLELIPWPAEKDGQECK